MFLLGNVQPFTYSVIRILDIYFLPHHRFESPSHLYLSDGVICGRYLSFVHVVFAYLIANKFCVRLRTTSYIYVFKAV